MSRENLEAVRAAYGELAKGNVWAGVELYAPDVVFEPAVERSSIHGLEAISEYMREFLEQWTDFRIEGLDYTEVGDSVVVKERQHATGRLSGAEMNQTFFAIWTFADGQIVRMRWELNRDEALRRAGGHPS
jgi:ketosteroid isomerase-like protein